VVIGETTGGGAHDNKFVILTDNFMMSLPFARAINPVTKTNWEEVGVEPDVKVSADKALETALAMASKALAEKEKDPSFKANYQWQQDNYESALNPVTIAGETLQSYTGTYGPRTITLEDGFLFYQREGRPKMKMIPIAKDYFMLEGIDYFRLKFLTEEGRVVAVEGHDTTGAVDKHLKNK
ncbi:MAG: S41 family peptidase, partial [Candidatus Aminicenantes bacterium]|nr:S41 family peptidase [Candidatus Aminicenantes bacterium]